MMTSSRSALFGVILLLALCWSGSAGAQESIPLPGDLALDAPGTVLRIDKPADGDRVETPFLVTGVAAPGSRLELWLGDTLNRVFMADADGRFTSAVSAPAPGNKLWVHQLDDSGQRVQSDGVSVVWSGEASPLTAPTPMAAGDSDRVIDPFATTPGTTTPTGLPRVSDLSTGPPSSGAPVPPPPSDDPFAPEASAEVPDTIASAEDAEILEPRPVTPSRGVRGIAEAGGALAGAAVFGLGGGLLGVGLGLAADNGDGFAALVFGLLGGMTGLAVGVPVGVVVTGNMMDGNGKWWAVVLGELAGLLAGGLLTSATFGSAPGVFSLFALPVLGSVLGYELSSDHSAWEAKYGKQARSLRPIITPTADGGTTVGFGFRF